MLISVGCEYVSFKPFGGCVAVLGESPRTCLFSTGGDTKLPHVLAFTS